MLRCKLNFSTAIEVPTIHRSFYRQTLANTSIPITNSSSFILSIVDHFVWRVWRFQRVEVRQKLIKLYEDAGNEKYDVFQKIVFVPLLSIRVLPVIME